MDDLDPLRQALPRPRGLCHFFVAGSCNKGDHCRFSHDQAAVSREVTRRDKGQHPCWFFARGLCQKGASCPFKHHLNAPPSASGTQADRVADSLADDEDAHDNFIRWMSGAKVYYEDGASVGKIVLESDCSTVRLSNLPDTISTEESIHSLLASLGISAPLDFVRVFKSLNTETDTYMADLRAEDPDFGKMIDKKLSAAHDYIRVTPMTNALARPFSESTGRHSTTKKVHISWYRPTRTAWLNFSKKMVAQVTKTSFDSGEYKLLGQQVRALGPSESQDRTKGSHVHWTVKLDSIPAETTKELILDCIEEGKRPQYTVLSDPSYTVDEHEACAAVRSMVTEVGTPEWWKTRTATGGPRIRALAGFASETEAREVVNAVQNAKVPFSPHIKLVLDLAISQKFSFLARINEVCASELDGLKSTWKTQRQLRVYDYDNERRFNRLKIEGRNAQDVARAATELETLLLGKVAEGDNGALWTPSLRHNGEAWQQVKMIEKQTGVVVLRDLQKCHIRVIGSEAKQAEAIGLIADIVEQDTSSIFPIELTPEQYDWAKHGGFSAISAILGRTVTKFDSLAEPKRILIVGSRRDHDKAVAIMSSQTVAEAASSDAEMCSVCWTEADEPVLTTCGHTYCAGCFEALAHFYASSASKFQCKGVIDKCRGTITLDDLHKHLSSSVFERVLEEALKAHIDSRPREYRHCSTPDCPQIFRVADSGAHVCTECLVVTCKKCGEAHDAMSCDEKKEDNSEEMQALRKAKAELGIKDCPKCGAAIEKDGGCNHMTCKCGAHICWCCIKAFNSSGECYTHLRAEHGGIGL